MGIFKRICLDAKRSPGLSVVKGNVTRDWKKKKGFTFFIFTKNFTKE